MICKKKQGKKGINDEEKNKETQCDRGRKKLKQFNVARANC
jgi:hypothetical protein